MVQQIEINGIAVRVLFGMYFNEQFSTYLQKCVDNNEEVEEGDIPGLIVWFGYLNWCKISKEPPIATQIDIALALEMIYHDDNEKTQTEMKSVMATFNNSKFGKAAQQVLSDLEADAKKKTTPIGQTLDSSLLVS